MKEIISVSEALDAAVHFGHHTNRWNPKMAPYIYGKREGIYIIDLTKTVEKFREAYQFLKNLAKEGKTILFVGTKKQAQEVIKEEAQRADAYYVVERWLGGTLTNFQTIKKSIDRLRELDRMEEEGEFDLLLKKETVKLKKDKVKLEKNLAGIKNMDEVPDCLVVVDARREKIAIAEARKLSIPIVSLIDTNCDPDDVDYPIPANEDTIKSIKLIVSRLADGILEGKREAIEPLAKKEEEEPEEDSENEVDGGENE